MPFWWYAWTGTVLWHWWVQGRYLHSISVKNKLLSLLSQSCSWLETWDVDRRIRDCCCLLSLAETMLSISEFRLAGIHISLIFPVLPFVMPSLGSLGSDQIRPHTESHALHSSASVRRQASYRTPFVDQQFIIPIMIHELSIRLIDTPAWVRIMTEWLTDGGIG